MGRGSLLSLAIIFVFQNCQVGVVHIGRVSFVNSKCI